MKMMRVVVKKPNETAKIMEIENAIESVRRVLDGSMEAWSLSDDIAIYCNSESAHNGSLFNCRVEDWAFYGNILVLKFNDMGDFDSFSEEEAKEQLNLFA